MTTLDLPASVVDAALQAYAERRWHHADIRHEATQIKLENEIREEAFNAALAVAYRAGYDLGEKLARARRGLCSHCGGVYGLNPSGVVRLHGKPRLGGQWAGDCEGSRKPPAGLVA